MIILLTLPRTCRLNKHETYIKRCIQIAKNGLGTSFPNPMVGSVIVHADQIIGEGHTSAYGGNHAEVNAIDSVKDKALLKDSTIYVTLEPCSHHGKTPPCADLIVKHQIPNVVIGTIDVHAKVAGKGIERLKNAGCNVTVGVLEKECLEHHKRFFTFHDKKRPYIILKWAETTDGFLAPNPSSREVQAAVWITNTYSRQLVHKWRSEEQAILVGTNTVLADNPSLTTRDWKGNSPVRIVIDRSGKISEGYSVLDGSVKTVVLIEKKEKGKKGIDNLIYEEMDFDSETASQICGALYKHNILSVIIEGGSQTLQTFIDAELWDEARVFTGTVSFGSGVMPPDFKGAPISEERILDDTLKTYHNP